MAEIEATFFDVDGVLLDSLEAHLQICRDKSREFNLPLRIPTAAEFRERVRQGAVISPMEEFFREVGFPDDLAQRADADYKKNFATRYPVHPFPGAREMLLRLADTGMPMGIVTANTTRIIEAALGEALTVFDPRCRFTLDDGRNLNKSQALIAGAAELRVPVTAAIYVGDQPRDFQAARTAGSQFLGVTFGWGISQHDSHFPIVDSLQEMERFLLERVR
jgi:phosphoglycolate phosphatase-like HAD superfamily hydrolase